METVDCSLDRSHAWSCRSQSLQSVSQALLVSRTTQSTWGTGCTWSTRASSRTQSRDAQPHQKVTSAQYGSSHMGTGPLFGTPCAQRGVCTARPVRVAPHYMRNIVSEAETHDTTAAHPSVIAAVLCLQTERHTQRTRPRGLSLQNKQRRQAHPSRVEAATHATGSELSTPGRCD